MNIAQTGSIAPNLPQPFKDRAGILRAKLPSIPFSDSQNFSNSQDHNGDIISTTPVEGKIT